MKHFFLLFILLGILAKYQDTEVRRLKNNIFVFFPQFSVNTHLPPI